MSEREDDRIIRVLLADDEHLFLNTLRELLSMEHDLSVVAAATSGTEALAMARAHHPDVAVLDLRMPGADGVEVSVALRGELPQCRAVIVTAVTQPDSLRRALSAGVRGVLPKTVTARHLAEVIRSVHAGGRYVDSELTADAISSGSSSRRSTAGPASGTGSEVTPRVV